MVNIYATIKANLLEHLRTKPIETFFINETRNYGTSLSVVYYQLGDITKFLDWLDKKVAEENSGASAGSVLLTTAGVSNPFGY